MPQNGSAFCGLENLMNGAFFCPCLLKETDFVQKSLFLFFYLTPISYICKL
jgi:hypothetical protein